MPGGAIRVKPRHQVIHDLIYYPVKLFLFLLYGFRADRHPIRRGSGPYLILCNHTTPLDPLCVGISFEFPVYYVASDHIFRLGFVSRLLDYLVAPIPIVKSRLDLMTIKDMNATIRQGGSVCLFPEGNRCFNGESMGFPDSVAKLAKQLKAPVLLYRLEGGYFTAPRWADTIRRGRMTGRVVRAISAGELAGLPSGELNRLIQSELYVNAYDNQRRQPVRYQGRRLAESLERALYLCPSCHGMATLKGGGDMLTCGCGLAARYTKYGFFQPVGEDDPPFETVLDWDRWQKRELPRWLEDGLRSAGEGPLFGDDGVRLYSCGRAGENTPLGEGRLSLHRDCFRFDGGGSTREFPIGGIQRLIIHGKQALQLTDGSGVTYELKTDRPFSALKYLNVFQLLKNRSQEVPDELLF